MLIYQIFSSLLGHLPFSVQFYNNNNNNNNNADDAEDDDDDDDDDDNDDDQRWRTTDVYDRLGCSS